MPFLRSDTAKIHVRLYDPANGKAVSFPGGHWVSMTGGDVQAQGQNVHLGGLLKTTNLGGPAQRSDVTVTRLYGASYEGFSVHSLISQLQSLAGSAGMAVSFTPIDADGNHCGETITLTGTLKQAQHPTWDSNSSNAAMLTLVMSADL